MSCATRSGDAPTHGSLASVLVIAIVAGCAGSVSSASPGAVTPPSPPAATPGTASAVASVRPSAATTAFPVEAFATLTDDPVQPDLASKLQAALSAMPPEGGGIAATVMTPDGTWSGAAGTADGVDDLAVDSQFGIGSGTKPIIAAQVMQLVEAGEISLDAPATEYLPDDFTFDTNGATVRQLLSHRSGIPDWYPAMKDQFALDRLRVWTLDEILALVPPARGPLGTIEYTDTNYNLLGLVIEHVRQRPLVDVLRDGVLRVDGTERLIWQPDEAPTDPMAMPRGEPRDALEQGGGYLPSRSDTIDGAAGGMASDSISLARWWRAFCAGEVVSRASLTEMSTFYRDVDDEYGLGLFNPAAGYAQGVGHLGGNFGYSSWSGCLTEEPLVVVVLRNFEDDDIFEMGRPLISAAHSG
jgi:D-alanyl-D-alanine carboxypeptidase